MAGTPAATISGAVSDTAANARTVLSEAQKASKAASDAAQAHIVQQQKDATARLLADAKTRGYTGGASPLEAEMVGGADRRAQSIEQGAAARDSDYTSRTATLDALYKQIAGLSTGLGGDARNSSGGGGGGGGGGGSGGGSGDYSVQTDLKDQLQDRQTAEDRYMAETPYLAFENRVAQLSPALQALAYKTFDAVGYDAKQAARKLADDNSIGGHLKAWLPTDNSGSWGSYINNGAYAEIAAARARDELIAFFRDIALHPESQRSTDTGRTQQTYTDTYNARNRVTGQPAPSYTASSAAAARSSAGSAPSSSGAAYQAAIRAAIMRAKNG